MRLAGQWLYNLQKWTTSPEPQRPAWLGIGFIVADWGGVLFLISLAVGGNRRAPPPPATERTALLKTTMAISLILALAYAVAVWAMTGKPN